MFVPSQLNSNKRNNEQNYMNRKLQLLKHTIFKVGFEVLTAVSMKIPVFWVVVPCSRAIALMMEAARTSETLVNFYQTTRRYNPEDSNLRTIFSSVPFPWYSFSFVVKQFPFV
jgi:hypothetical protein